ncbi:hypothetical protein D3C71_1153980 [compost metagenome]
MVENIFGGQLNIEQVGNSAKQHHDRQGSRAAFKKMAVGREGLVAEDFFPDSL